MTRTSLNEAPLTYEEAEVLQHMVDGRYLIALRGKIFDQYFQAGIYPSDFRVEGDQVLQVSDETFLDMKRKRYVIPCSSRENYMIWSYTSDAAEKLEGYFWNAAE